MKCEKCHEGEAAHQMFGDNGEELYVCDKCFEEWIVASAQAVLEKPIEEKPDFSVFDKVADYDYTEANPRGIAGAAASVLADVRKQLGGPKGFKFSKNTDDAEIGSEVRFIAEDGKIRMDFFINLPDGEKSDTLKDPVKSEWTFDCSDVKNVSMKAWCHFGDERSKVETTYRFTDKDAPVPALATLTAILGGIKSSQDELVCDFD